VTSDTSMGMHSLGTLGGLGSYGYDINNARQVVGRADTGALFDDDRWIFHAFLWQDGVMIDLGTLPGDDFSSASRINQGGDIVGWSRRGFFDGISRAVLWHDGTAIDLNTRIPPDSGWVLRSTSDINDAGQIIGHGLLDGQNRGFLLTPIP
ncbi:hypothetical protein MNBD_PLANCTO03-484, partial [hydrothermal vent metagenome]